MDMIDYKKLEYRRLSLELDVIIRGKRPDWKKAIQIQTLMCGIYPNHYNYCDRGELHMANSNWIAAIEDFTTAIAYYPKKTTFEFRACCYKKLGQYDHAMLDIHNSETIGIV